MVVAQDPSRYTVTFLPGGQLSIRADCNQGVGAYTQLGASLTLQLGPMTLAACEPGSQDTVYLRDLGEVASYRMYGQDLVLNLRSDAGIMIFTRQRPTPVAGTRWRLQAYYDVQSFRSPLIETEITALFGADGTITGSAGCNVYRGTYTVDNGAISIGALVTTRRVCPDAIMEQERAYLAALGRGARYTIAGGLLTLHATDDTRLADFERAATGVT
jgi:heat shock protein HslJ